MQEIKLLAWGKNFILNNDSDKYERAKREAGSNASPEEVLAFYDRLAGLVKDEQGNKIENGSFWEIYKRKKEEQPEYIKILEDRERNLEESEKRIIELNLKNIDHKRAFLGTTMTISAAIIAGLFILLTNKNYDGCFSLLVMTSASLFAVFMIGSSIYLTSILAQESLALDGRFKFIRESKRDFIEKVGIAIIDIDSYEKYREQKYKEGKGLEREIKGSHEIWFVLLNILFILPFILLFATFLLRVINL